MFADDTSTYPSDVNLHKLVKTSRKYQYRVVIISDWFKANKLSLNISKTNFILFTKSKHIKIRLYIDNTEIEEQLSTKFLGIIINSKLIKYCKSKLACSLYAMNASNKYFKYIPQSFYDGILCNVVSLPFTWNSPLGI